MLSSLHNDILYYKGNLVENLRYLRKNKYFNVLNVIGVR